MSLINKHKEIPDMYNVRHKHDVWHEDYGYDYTENLFNNSIPKFLLLNDKIKYFTTELSKIFSVMIDNGQSIKNFFYYTHNKYYNKNGR